MRFVDGGYFVSLSAGRMGRGEKLPPQLGQTPCSAPSAQAGQKVHSKVQITAAASGGRSRSQHSQLGLSSSMTAPANNAPDCSTVPLPAAGQALA